MPVGVLGRLGLGCERQRASGWLVAIFEHTQRVHVPNNWVLRALVRVIINSAGFG